MYTDLGLSGYRGDRIKESLIEKGLIVQEETRGGKRGRLAKVLVLTDQGTERTKQINLPGKGGDAHKRLGSRFRNRPSFSDGKPPSRKGFPVV